MWLMIVGMLLQGASLPGAAPSWWQSRGATLATRPKDDYALLNQGQLKNFVRANVDEMNACLPGGAGPELTALLAGWRAKAAQADDYAAVNIGQLKAVGALVYKRLHDFDMPLLPPWSTTTTDDDNYAVANVGQAKATFKFTVPNFNSYGAADDPDQDGYSSAVEYAMGTNPGQTSSAPTTPPGLTPPMIKPKLVLYYRGLSALAFMTGFPDFTGQTARRFTTRQTELTSSKSAIGGGTYSGYTSSMQHSFENTSTHVEAYQNGVVTASMGPDAGNVVTTAHTYSYDSSEYSSSFSSSNPASNGFSDYKWKKTGDMFSTNAKLTYSYKEVGTNTQIMGPFTQTSVIDYPNFGQFLWLDGMAQELEVSTTVTSRATTFDQSRSTNIYYPVSEAASGSMAETLSGEITTSQLVAALQAEVQGHPMLSPQEFEKAFSLSSYFRIDLNYASATDYEYYYAVEWPEGTAEERKDKRRRLVKITEGYVSDDLATREERVRTVTVSASSHGSPGRLSALNFNNGKSGRANISVNNIEIPINIVIQKKGAGTTPASGLLVKTGDVLTFAIDSAYLGTAKQHDDIIKWEVAQLKGDGSYTAWTSLGAHATGTTFEHVTTQPGVFKARVRVGLSGGYDYHEYVRKADAPNATDASGKYNDKMRAGMPDFYGVADSDIQIGVRNQAHSNLGSVAYAKSAAFTPVGFGVDPTLNFKKSWKCNIFVFRMANSAGAAVPTKTWRDYVPGLPPWVDRAVPPGANDWYSSSFSIPNWTWLAASAMPQPGDAAVHQHLNVAVGGAAHIGILDYDGSWINAGKETVNKSIHVSDGSYQPTNYRRYTTPHP